MRTHFPVVAIATAAVGAGALIVACTGNDAAYSGVAAGDADAGNTASTDSGAPSPDGSSSADGAAADAAGAVPQAYLRLAHWSPDAPAVDVCFAPPGGSGTWQLVVFGQGVAADDAGTLGDGGDGGATGLTFPQVTSYFVVTPGTYAVRLVAAGAVDCATSLVDLASVMLGANTYTTVAAVGEATPVGTDQALALVAFSDDVTAPASQIALRFINASPSNPLLAHADLGTGSIAGTAGPFAALFKGVPFGHSGTSAQTDAGAVDPNGYLATSQLTGATLSAHATMGAQDTTTALNDVTVNGGSAATIALVNGVGNGGAAKLLLCFDVDDSSGARFRAQCRIVSTQ